MISGIRNLLANGPAERRGPVMVLLAVLAANGLVFMAVSADVEYLASVKTDLQRAANDIALTCAARLGAGRHAVRQYADQLVMKRNTRWTSIVVENGIEIGNWDAATRTFAADADNLNAIRVTARAEGRGLFAAPVVGCSRASVEAQAVAVRKPQGINLVAETDRTQ